MGNETATVMGLEVVAVDRKEGVVSIKGAIPGPYGGLVKIIKTGVIKGYVAPPEEKDDEDEVPSDVEQMAAGDTTEVPEEAPAESNPSEPVAETPAVEESKTEEETK
jgi:hypothetical protein